MRRTSQPTPQSVRDLIATYGFLCENELAFFYTEVLFTLGQGNTLTVDDIGELSRLARTRNQDYLRDQAEKAAAAEQSDDVSAGDAPVVDDEVA